MATSEPRTVVEKVTNARRYSDGTILLMGVRASFPHVLVPQEGKDDDGKPTKSYSIQGLMDKTTHDEAKKMCVRSINTLLKESNKGEKIPSAKKFIRDGDPADEDDAGKPEHAGMWVVSARETKRPICLANKKDPDTGKPRRLSPDDSEDVDMIYGGCYVNILIRPWFQNNRYGKRVNAGLAVVQFKRKGEPFGSGRIADSDVDETFSDQIDETDEEDDDPL